MKTETKNTKGERVYFNTASGGEAATLTITCSDPALEKSLAEHFRSVFKDGEKKTRKDQVAAAADVRRNRHAFWRGFKLKKAKKR